MIDRYGASRYVADSGAVLVHQDAGGPSADRLIDQAKHDKVMALVLRAVGLIE